MGRFLLECLGGSELWLSQDCSKKRVGTELDSEFGSGHHVIWVESCSSCIMYRFFLVINPELEFASC